MSWLGATSTRSFQRAVHHSPLPPMAIRVLSDLQCASMASQPDPRPRAALCAAHYCAAHCAATGQCPSISPPIRSPGATRCTWEHRGRRSHGCSSGWRDSRVCRLVHAVHTRCCWIAGLLDLLDRLDGKTASGGGNSNAPAATATAAPCARAISCTHVS